MVTVTLESADGENVFASVHIPRLFRHWHKHTAVLRSNGTDATARLAFRLGKGRPPEGPAGPRYPWSLGESSGRSLLQLRRGEPPAGLAGAGRGASAPGAEGAGGPGDGSPGEPCSKGGSGVLLLDVVSLFPDENGPEGSVTPFRNDLLQLIKGLRPRCGAGPPARAEARACQ